MILPDDKTLLAVLFGLRGPEFFNLNIFYCIWYTYLLRNLSDMFLKANFGSKVLHEARNNLTKSLVVEKNSTKYLVCNKTKRFRSCDESVTNLFSQCLMLL